MSGWWKLWFLAAAAAVAAVLAAGPAAAAVVHLAGGDRITGDIVGMAGGKLTLKTAYAGQVVISWAKVTRLENQQPLTVELAQGETLTAPLAAPADGKLGLGRREVELASVAAIKPPGVERLRIKGQVNVGADSWSGNTDKERWDLDGALTLRQGPHRLAVGAESHRENNKGKDTVDNDLVHAEYNRFISKKWYALANARASQDKFKGINHRLGGGLGLGYQFWDTDLSSLSVELGPNYFSEDSDVRGQRQWTAARWALELEHWLFDRRLQFFHNHQLFVRVDRTSQYFYNTRTGLRLPIGWGIVTSLVYAFDWDNDPDPGREEEDSRLTFKLGYAW